MLTSSLSTASYSNQASYIAPLSPLVSRGNKGRPGSGARGLSSRSQGIMRPVTAKLASHRSRILPQTVTMRASPLSRASSDPYVDEKGRERVVITGMGTVNCLGNSVEESWQKAKAGQSGIAEITKFDTTSYPVKIADEVKGLSLSDHFSRKELKEMDPMSLFAIVAGDQAMKQAKLMEGDGAGQMRLALPDPERAGVSLGTCMTGLRTVEANMASVLNGKVGDVEVRTHPKYLPNMPAGLLSIRYNLQGPNWAMSTACATGNHNTGMAARAIQWGEADIMVAGGTDEGVTPFSLAGFVSINALSKRNEAPELASRPWQVGRDGFVLAEGAAVLVLESQRSAVERGAEVLGVVSGFGSAGDAEHVTKPPKNGHGGARAQINALRDAGLSASDISYINAHGTSTPLGDWAELRGIEGSFAAFNADPTKTPISSTKSMHRHALGAAGAIELVLCVKAMEEGIIPPTINLSEPDRDCGQFDLVPNAARTGKLNHILSNSYGFGGTDSALIITNPNKLV